MKKKQKDYFYFGDDINHDNSIQILQIN
jgi:hypothetical protein